MTVDLAHELGTYLSSLIAERKHSRTKIVRVIRNFVHIIDEFLSCDPDSFIKDKSGFGKKAASDMKDIQRLLFIKMKSLSLIRPPLNIPLSLSVEEIRELDRILYTYALMIPTLKDASEMEAHVKRVGDIRQRISDHLLTPFVSDKGD